MQEIFAWLRAQLECTTTLYRRPSLERRCVLWEAIFGGPIDGLQLAFELRRGRLHRNAEYGMSYIQANKSRYTSDQK